MRIPVLGRPGSFGADQLEVECNRNAVCNLVLQGEKIAGVAVEPLCPQMHIGFGIDQLGSDADPGSRPLDLPFEHIAHAKLAANLLRVDRFVSVSESGIARDHQHIRDPRKIGRQISGDPVGKIFLLGIVARIDKGQHDDRGTWRWGGLRA